MATRPPGYAEPDRLVVLEEPRPQVIEHTVAMVETGAFARAVCSGCGWSGPARRSRSSAALDADRHPAPPGS